MNNMKVNPQLIKDEVQRRGENGLVKLSADSGLSISLLSQLMAGSYPRGLRLRTAKVLGEALGVEKLEDLFLEQVG
jgi:lambda repressor-like predicted transcriptional regulator